MQEAVLVEGLFSPSPKGEGLAKLCRAARLQEPGPYTGPQGANCVCLFWWVALQTLGSCSVPDKNGAIGLF